MIRPGATRSMRVTAVIRPSRDMRSPSWFRLERGTRSTLEYVATETTTQAHSARRSHPARTPFRDETLLHQALVAEQGRTPMRGNRYISPALTEPMRKRHARICRKHSIFPASPEAPVCRPLHLSRFDSKSLFYMNHRKGRRGRLKHPEALHLSRQSVASLTASRCNSLACALHLSGKEPFSSIKSDACGPLL